MSSYVKKLPDFELEVMGIIWGSADTLHTGEILKRLPENKCSVQALQSILRRLEEKGALKCNKLGRLNYYSPLISESDYKAGQALSLVDKLFGSSPVQLVAALVEHGSLSDEDLEEIRHILEKER